MKHKSIHGDRAKMLLYNAILLLKESGINHEIMLKKLGMSEKEYKQLMKE